MRRIEDICATQLTELDNETSLTAGPAPNGNAFPLWAQAYPLAQWEDDEDAFDEDDEDVEYMDEDDDPEDEDWEDEEFDIDEDDFDIDDDEEMDFEPYDDDEEEDDDYFDDDDEPEDHWGHQVEDVLPSPCKPAYYVVEARFK